MNVSDLINRATTYAAQHYPHLTQKQARAAATVWASKHHTMFGDATSPSEPEIRMALMTLERAQPEFFRVPPTPAEVSLHLLKDTKDPQQRMIVSRQCAALDADERLAALPYTPKEIPTGSAADDQQVARTASPVVTTRTDEDHAKEAKELVGAAAWDKMKPSEKGLAISIRRKIHAAPVAATSQLAAELSVRGMDKASPTERLQLYRETQAAAAAKLKG